MVEGISELRDGVLLGERYRLLRRLEVFSAGADRVAGVEYEYWVALDETARSEVWIEFAGAGGVYAEGAALAGSVAALRRINHPAVPAVHAFGEYEFERDGMLRSVGYCAIPALEGETLAAAMVRETLDRAEILLALGQVAEVLQLLGEFELVHGHLSAHSVLLQATAEAGYAVVLADLPVSLALETAVESELTAAADVYALAWLTVLVLVGPSVLEAEFGAGFAATLEFELAAERVLERRQAWAAENLEVLGVSAGLAEVLLLALGESAARPRVTMLAAAIRAAWVEIQQQAAAVESAGLVEQAVAVAEVAEVAALVEVAEAVEAVEAVETVELAEAQAGGLGAVGVAGKAGKGPAKKNTKKRAVETAAVVGAAGALGLVAAESAAAETGSAGSAGSTAATLAGSGSAGGAGASAALVGETVAVEQAVAAQESAGAVTEVIPVIGGGRRGRGGSGSRPGSPSSGGSIGTGTGASTGTAGGAGRGGAGGAGSASSVGAAGGAGGSVSTEFSSGPVGGGASGGGSSGGGTAAHRRRPRRGLYAGIGAGVLVVVVVLVIVLNHGSGGHNNTAGGSSTPTTSTTNSATNSTATSSTGSATSGASAAAGASPSTAASPSPNSAQASATATGSAGESGSGSTTPAETVTFPATLETYPASPGEALQQIQTATNQAQGELSQTQQGQLGQIIGTLQQEIGSNQSVSTGTAQLWALLHSGELPSSFNNYLEQLASYLSASGGS